MYRYRILTIAAACLCIFNTLLAVSGPERILPGSIQPAPGEQMGIGDDGPTVTMHDTVSVVPSRGRAAAPAPSHAHAAPASRTTHVRQQLLRGEGRTSRLAQDPAKVRHGWVSWVAIIAGGASIAAIFTVIVLGIVLWEFFSIFVLIWFIGAILALIFGAFALGFHTINHRKIGIAGFILGCSSLVLPFLILIGLVVFALLDA